MNEHRNGAVGVSRVRVENRPPANTASVMNPLLDVRLLGGFRVARADARQAAFDWPRRSAKTLTKLLAAHPGHAMHREQIISILWPEVGAELALKSLGNALHGARRVLEPGLPRRQGSAYLRTAESMLVLDTERVVVDADLFERLAAHALGSGRGEAYQSALLAYEGELLPEDRHESWCAERRSALMETYIRLLLGLAEVYERCGACDEAADQLREVLRQDPTREAVHRQLMRLYVRMGAADRAVRQFHVCEEALRRELDLAPQPETVSLYDAIHADRFPRRPPAIDQDRDNAAVRSPARTANNRAWEQGRKIVICDTQRMLAEALASALDVRGYHVLAVTTTVSDVVIAVGAGRPDVCLLGLQACDQLSGFDAVRAVRQRYPDTKVLVLSEVTHPKTLSQLMRSGVEGLTHQDQSVDQIASALDAVVDGRNVLDPGPLRHPARSTERQCELSPREKEILARIVSGQSTRQMSFAMNVTVGTVRTYVKNVLAKLGAHSRLQLAALASRDGSLIDQAVAVDSLPFAGEPASRSHRGSLLEERTRGRGRGW